MADDPTPHLRCRCVHRTQDPELLAIAGHLISGPDPYWDRCPGRPTGEDGLCDHCRGDGPHECAPDNIQCCLHPSQRRAFVDLGTPCFDRRSAQVTS